MRIYPAVDIKGGRAVRLIQGKEDQATDYGVPVQAARMWQEQGAAALHVVDLDGAFTGESANLTAVSEIVKALSIPVQLGGGIRSLDDVEDRLSRGVSRVILGTAALENPEMMAIAAKEFPHRIVVGIDALNGKVAVKGWVESSEMDPIELALSAKSMGVDTVIYTDISRDGMLVGPNIEAMDRMVQATGMNVIASGGVGALADIAALSRINVEGVIVGKALYQGAFTLAQALQYQK